MLRALLLGAALLVVSSTSDACSPVEYDSPKDRLTDALRYYVNAEWIAVGTVTSVDFVSADDIWKVQQRDEPDVIRAGTNRLPMAFESLHAPVGIKYTFATVLSIKGEVAGTTYVKFVDLLPTQHPREAAADWPQRIAIGAHQTFASCDLAPSFAIGQQVLLIKPKQRIFREYFRGSDGVDVASIVDFGSAHFRSLEPTTRSDEWYRAVKVAAKLDQGGWPIGIAVW